MAGNVLTEEVTIVPPSMAFWSSKPKQSQYWPHAQSTHIRYKRGTGLEIRMQRVAEITQQSWRVRISTKLLKKIVVYPGVEVQIGRSSRIFVIPSPDLSICILSAELGSCMYQSQFFSHLCAGGKCRISGWCQVPILVEDGPTVQCNRNFPLSSPKLSLNYWSRYLGDLVLDISSLQIQVYNLDCSWDSWDFIRQ